jgi:Raf kinase inhibitor-like YbhB/YbcL family protein
VRRSALIVIVIALFVAATALAACGGDGSKLPGGLPAATDAIKLSSPTIQEGGAISPLYTCDGSDTSPPLRWSRPPAGTKSLAVLMLDLDASSFVHWAMFDIVPSIRELGEGVVPQGAKQGENSFGHEYYNGPCPPEGKTHRYQFALYALKADSGLDNGASAADVRDAIDRLKLARGVMSGTFGR